MYNHENASEHCCTVRAHRTPQHGCVLTAIRSTLPLRAGQSKVRQRDTTPQAKSSQVKSCQVKSKQHRDICSKQVHLSHLGYRTRAQGAEILSKVRQRDANPQVKSSQVKSRQVTSQQHPRHLFETVSKQHPRHLFETVSSHSLHTLPHPNMRLGGWVETLPQLLPLETLTMGVMNS